MFGRNFSSFLDAKKEDKNMKVIDIKRLRCSFYENASGEKDFRGPISIAIDLGLRWKDKIDVLRGLTYHSEEQKALKPKYPCWTPAGIFNGSPKDENIIEYTNLVAIDVDGIDNKGVDMDKLKRELFELPYVVFVSKSISAAGVYALVLLEDGHNQESHCRYIERLWRQEYGVDIDKKCYNIGRKRFISYDEDLLMKDDDVDIIPFKLKYITPIQAPNPTPHIDCSRYKHNDDKDGEFEKKVGLLIKYGFDIGPHWGDWMSFGRCFKPFEKGLELFNEISSKMSAYDSKTFMRDWNKVKCDFDKDHALAYLTFLLNKDCPGWKTDYYQKEELNLFSADQPPI